MRIVPLLPPTCLSSCSLRARAALAVVVVALVGGCSFPTAEPPQQDSFFTLEIGELGRSYEEPILDGIVEVSRFGADGLTGERPIVHTRDGVEFRQYNYHFWIESPAVLMRDAMVAALRRSNAAARAVTPDTRLLSDYRLNGRLQRLHHQRGDGQAEVRLSAEIAITRARDGALVMIDSYDIRRPLREDSIAEAVREIRAALTQMTAEMLDDLERSAPARTAADAGARHAQPLFM